MWIRAGGGGEGQPMWIVFIFYNTIIKSANVDKKMFFCLNPSFINKKSSFFYVTH